MQILNFKVQNYFNFSFCNFHFAIFILLIILLASPGLAFAQLAQEQLGPQYMRVVADNVNIRAGQGLNFEIIGQLNKGGRVAVLAEADGWHKIKLPKQALCFVHKDYIEDGLVKANKLYVRAGGGPNFNILGRLRKGQSVEVLEKQGEWLRITPPEGSSGWVKADYLRQYPISAPKKEQPQTNQEEIEACGRIEDLGNIINCPARHKLVDGKKTLYYLNTKALDLNLYIYETVCVSGKLQDKENCPYPVLDVEQLKRGQQ